MALLSNLLKEVGGKALSIGGILNYGLRKGIYQSLSEDKMKQLTYFVGYDETTAISPDFKLALWPQDLVKKQVSK